MSQNDLVIANQSFPATRADINSALQALGSSNSGTTEPATTYANMFWYDTTAKVLKLRSEANDAWISIGYFDQSANAFRILDNTQVTDTSGTQTGLLGDQATATWEAGTGTTESLVSPAKVKAAVIAAAPDNAIGVGQTWQNVKASRAANTTYQNTTGKPIMVNCRTSATSSAFRVSSDNVTFVDAVGGGNGEKSAIVPNNIYYRLFNDNNNLQDWAELR
jgi:hypothetical protein